MLVRIGYWGARGAGEDRMCGASEDWMHGGPVVPVEIGYFRGPLQPVKIGGGDWRWRFQPRFSLLKCP